MNLTRVILSWPTLLSAPATASGSTAPRSWIQIARTGSFTSNRYGQFSITRDDLAQMLHNFNNVTPKAPTELPIDYDHLSMDPKRPGDGIAAGWMKKLELRNNGDELWAEAEWTEDGADRIRKREYRFISPSFVKDHVHKDGRKIGTTLIASALTCHPFLEGMSALTLYSFSAMGDLALVAPSTTASTHLAELGQHVAFLPDAERTPELTDEERGQTLVIKTVIGEGDGQFVRLATLDGREFGWFRASVQLAPAPAPKPERTTPEDTTMQDTKTTETDIERRAAAFAHRVTALSNGRTLRDAINLATTEDAEGAEAYRLAGIGAEPVAEAPAPISLSARTGESFDDLAHRYANEHGVSLRQAVHEVGKARPDLAAARG
jgi:hypothetical protein